MSKKWQAILELLTATLIWGFGFVATNWALRFFDTVTINFSRFLISGLVGLAIVYLASMVRRQNFSLRNLTRQYLFLACGPGILIGLMIAFQTWGLELTSVINSGFITTLYVIFVPLFGYLFFREIPRMWHYLWLIMALVGTAFMVGLKFTAINNGDIYTLVCAVLGAAQIVWISRVSDRIHSAFIFNVYQSFWASLASLVFWPFYGKYYVTLPDFNGTLGMIGLIFGSTLLAFALQVKAQKVINPNLASLLFLLESPFAAIFAFWLLKEKMGFNQYVGAALILTSALCATQTAKPKKRHEKN